MKEQTWYREIGFYSNPFSIKPAAFDNEVYGANDEIKKIIKLIKSDECCFISGEYGTGKTTVLKKIIGEFRGKGKLIFYSFSLSTRSLDIERLLIGRSSFFKRLFRIKATNVILLLDEVQDMLLKDSAQIKEFHDEDYFSSVIFVGKELGNTLPKDIKEMVGSNIFTFRGLNDKDAVKLARQRIGPLKMISDESIAKINKKSSKPRDFLKNMEDVFRYAVDNDEEIAEKTITAALANR